jgi:hypothetical protein
VLSGVRRDEPDAKGIQIINPTTTSSISFRVMSILSPFLPALILFQWESVGGTSPDGGGRGGAH